MSIRDIHCKIILSKKTLDDGLQVMRIKIKDTFVEMADGHLIGILSMPLEWA